MFDRWRYRGRHRGEFAAQYRSPEAFAEVDARWCTIQSIPPAAPRRIVVGPILIRDFVPPWRWSEFAPIELPPNDDDAVTDRLMGMAGA